MSCARRRGKKNTRAGGGNPVNLFIRCAVRVRVRPCYFFRFFCFFSPIPLWDLRRRRFPQTYTSSVGAGTGKKKTLYSPAGGNGAPTTRRFYIHYRVAYIIWSYRVQPLRLGMYSILYMQLCVPTTNNFSNLNKLSNGQCINRGPWYRPVMQISSRPQLVNYIQERGNVANGRVSSVEIRLWVITRVVFLVCVKMK